MERSPRPFDCDSNKREKPSKKLMHCASALPDWTNLSVNISNPDFPITWIEIHAMTNQGVGTHRGFDKPVYVDDFSLSILPGQP